MIIRTAVRAVAHAGDDFANAAKVPVPTPLAAATYQPSGLANRIGGRAQGPLAEEVVGQERVHEHADPGEAR